MNGSLFFLKLDAKAGLSPRSEEKCPAVLVEWVNPVVLSVVLYLIIVVLLLLF